MENNTYKLLIAATGSVAAMKLPILIKALKDLHVLEKKFNFEVRTWVYSSYIKPAQHFRKNLARRTREYIQETAENIGSTFTFLWFSRVLARFSRGCGAGFTDFCGSKLQRTAPQCAPGITGDKLRIIVTEHAKHFYNSSEIPSEVIVYDDKSEWVSWRQRGDPVLHIELGKWADMMIIAPLDANTLAKMANGICDNLLTCTTRAWDISKPLLFCPAMNTRMWQHPITCKQVLLLKEWGHEEIPPISKLLMCGDTGLGAMAEVGTIVSKVKEKVEEKFR